MPEIGEVAKIVHQLRKHWVGKTISSVRATEDTLVFKDTTPDLFKNAITGKEVVGAGQQGKYFWIALSSPPHIIAHFGMTGWMTFSNETSGWYRPKKEENEWPPKFWKFLISAAEDPKCEVVFTDARRLARIRLVDCEASQIRNHSPLKENGPDPVIDREKLNLDWFVEKVRARRVPVKAWLLDQANLSGVGNWVGDEILYDAKIHPEQYTNSLNDAQLSQLFESTLGVCSIAVETLAEEEKFPEGWLMRYRWNKGKKDKNRLPNGQKIEFVKVGGRSSAFVPSVQKITGSTANGETSNTKKRAPFPKPSPQEPQKIARGKGKTANEDDRDAGKEDNEEAGAEEEPRPKKRKTLTIGDLWGKKTDKKP
ncbi:hypothetical protein GP486_002085 [Trichoglossum hirsutum]|uniref:Formamidopyrimidine-DNA glycosylase catalytic domain-containing protein n=1 Tax=Trichoglossum hirsutum TaxID=265104 RepID=A0A9P8LFW4_9PEZI|nr:hypothetical protein GP486_002085 [Trichoglossum hirsutum]